MKTIVIDPGHGGYDRYNVGYSGKYIEADGNLEFSLFVKDFLKDYFKVILTRESDITLSLSKRANIAIENKADIFISVHSDAWNKEANGVTVYDSVDLKNETIAKSIGEAVAKGMGIKFKGTREKESLKYPNEDYYTVIDKTQDNGIPVVLLLERGFHSNPKEEKLLLDSSLVKESARLAAEVIKEYYMVDEDWRIKTGLEVVHRLDDSVIDSPEYWEKLIKINPNFGPLLLLIEKIVKKY